MKQKSHRTAVSSAKLQILGCKKRVLEHKEECHTLTYLAHVFGTMSQTVPVQWNSYLISLPDEWM